VAEAAADLARGALPGASVSAPIPPTSCFFNLLVLGALLHLALCARRRTTVTASISQLGRMVSYMLRPILTTIFTSISCLICSPATYAEIGGSQLLSSEHLLKLTKLNPFCGRILKGTSSTL
jgi:hypothetical protein